MSVKNNKEFDELVEPEYEKDGEIEGKGFLQCALDHRFNYSVINDIVLEQLCVIQAHHQEEREG